MTDVLLATCAALPDGEPGGKLVVTALAERGIAARWAVWDDPDVDWAASLVAVRSTWDYDGRREAFLDWAASVPRLLNGAEVFAWNTDKAYLCDLLEAGLPVVPTASVDDAADLPAAVDGFGRAVLKPRIGAGGRGVVLLDRGATFDAGAGPWVVQPLVESVRTEGEQSAFVLGGEVVAAVRKLPGAGEIRVHEEYGGQTAVVPVDEELVSLARRAVATAEELVGCGLDYARVDTMRLDDGTLALSELEVTEPGLYLDVLPENAGPFAEVVVRRLRDGG